MQTDEKTTISIDDITKYIKDELDDLDKYVNGDKRPKDLLVCGEVEGSWNTLIKILNKIGVKHNYRQV